MRTLIWEGASHLVVPHEPLTFPDGEQDSINILRPLIGYGPEAMWIAYNRFYPPALAHIEARNASPDRSHNETWDSLVVTGLFGFLAYMAVFISIFYWALRLAQPDPQPARQDPVGDHPGASRYRWSS